MSKPEVLSLGLGKAAGSTHREVTVTELRQGTDSKSGLTPPPCTALLARAPSGGWTAQSRFKYVPNDLAPQQSGPCPRPQPGCSLSSHSASCIPALLKPVMLSLTTGPSHRRFSPPGSHSPSFPPSNTLLHAQSLHTAKSSTSPRTKS